MSDFTERFCRICAAAKKKAAEMGWRNWLVLICFFCFHLFLLRYHEAWRDEAQAWTIGRNYSLQEIVKDLSNEGHPILWFLCIKIVTFFGLHYRFFGFVSLIAVTAAAYVLLKWCPLPFFLKICIIISALFTYYNPVIARSYSVALLIVVILAALYGQRDRYPIAFGIATAALYQTHIHLAGLAIGLTAVSFIHVLKKKNRKRHLAGFGLECASFVFLVMTLHQPAGSPTAYQVDLIDKLKHIKYVVKTEFFINGIKSVENHLWSVFWLDDRSFAVFRKLIFAVLVILAVSVIAVMIWQKAWEPLLMTTVMAAFAFGEYFAVVSLIYGPHNQMATCFLMLVLFFAWILFENRDKAAGWRWMRCLLTAIILICFVCTYPSLGQSVRTDLRMLYSGSREMAGFIIEQAEPDSIVLINYAGEPSSVYAYTADERKDLIWWEMDEWQRFRVHVWGKTLENTSAEMHEIKKRIRDEFPDADHVYYLSVKKCEKEGLTLLHAMTENNVKNECYWFYEVK